MNKTEDQVLALAGLLQASSLVVDLAHQGDCDPLSMQPLIDSLFRFNTDSTLDVYGGNLHNLNMGLRALEKMLGNQQDKYFAQQLKTALSVLAQEKQASRSKELMNILHSRLSHLEYKRNHFSKDDNVIYESLSALYQDTLSQLKFRVMVNGSVEHLKNPAVSNKIRALLLTGFRSAVLWRQMGGSKWQLVFSRRKQARICADLLKQIQ